MSFRQFILFCMLCGAWMGLLGWVFGRVLLLPFGSTSDSALMIIFAQGVRGMLLGMFIAFGIGVIDGLWSLSLQKFGVILLRVMLAALVGAFGGFVGGLIGQSLSLLTRRVFGSEGVGKGLAELVEIFGWTLTGLLIGVSIASFEVIASMMQRQNVGSALRKLRNGILGGAVGGLLGGILRAAFKGLWDTVFSDRPVDQMWSPSAIGFVVLGMCIGLLIGLAQVILRDSWIRVERGFKAGREMLLAKAETTVGRAESCDLGLFGDSDVERLHARIIREGQRYFLADADTPGGTFLNDRRISQREPLRSGDRIQVGGSVLRFHERRKQTDEK